MSLAERGAGERGREDEGTPMEAGRGRRFPSAAARELAWLGRRGSRGVPSYVGDRERGRTCWTGGEGRGGEVELREGDSSSEVVGYASPGLERMRAGGSDERVYDPIDE